MKLNILEWNPELWANIKDVMKWLFTDVKLIETQDVTPAAQNPFVTEVLSITNHTQLNCVVKVCSSATGHVFEYVPAGCAAGWAGHTKPSVSVKRPSSPSAQCFLDTHFSTAPLELSLSGWYAAPKEQRNTDLKYYIIWNCWKCKNETGTLCMKTSNLEFMSAKKIARMSVIKLIRRRSMHWSLKWLIFQSWISYLFWKAALKHLL